MIQRLIYRDQSYNNMETFCTFKEYMEIAKNGNVGIYPEFKSASFTNDLLKSRGHKTTVYELILKELKENGYEVDGYGVIKEALVLKTKDNHIASINTKFIDQTH